MANNKMHWQSLLRESNRLQISVLPEENLPTSQSTSRHVQTNSLQSPAPVTTASQLPSPFTSGLGSKCMQPTWKGFIHTTRDGLTLLEACIQGHLCHIPRRPHIQERQSLISSGNIFVYEENASGIRRWTDGIYWSPSRIMGNFFVYRELYDGPEPGEKKIRATKKRGRDGNITSSDSSDSAEEDRQLIGSLYHDVYNYKPGGLVKKTLNIELRGVRHHIISYYRVEDIKNGQYHRPTEDEFLRTVKPRIELIQNPGLRLPIDDDQDDKIKVVVSPKSRLEPSSVIPNVPQHSAHLPHSSPHGISAHTTAFLAPQGTAAGGYHSPTGQLDLFGSDVLCVAQRDYSRYSIPDSTPVIGQNSPTALNPISPTTRQIWPFGAPAGERDRTQQTTGGSQMANQDSSPHLPQSLEWYFPTIPSHSRKYVGDMSYHESFIASVQNLPFLPTAARMAGDTSKCLKETNNPCDVIGWEYQYRCYCCLS
jgi:Gti1/Pac2 family transcription factor